VTNALLTVGLIVVVLALYIFVVFPLMNVYGDKVTNQIERNTVWWTRILRRLGARAGQIPIVACRLCGRRNRLIGGEKNARCSACHEDLAVRVN